MGYNSYFANIAARLALLCGSFIGLAFLIIHTGRFFTVIFLVALIIIQIISLFRFLNKTNRNLARFLLLLTEEEVSVTAWKDRVEKTFQGLHHSFKKVNEEIGRIRLEKEKGTLLLQHIVDHIRTGILVSNDQNGIELINEEARRLFQTVPLERLDDLNRIKDGLAEEFTHLRYERGNIIPLPVDGEDLPALVCVSAFRLGDRKLKLFSVQGIKNQLEANEIESWQKLTRVLAHEISNSVTPISTLGSGIQRKLLQASRENNNSMLLSGRQADDLIQSANLIEKRCNALVDFMDHYQSFTRLPDPVPEEIQISGFFESLRLYFYDDMNKSGIHLDTQVTGPELKVRADRALLEQAFINLIRNSVEALAGREDGKIELRAQARNGRIYMEVSDNGPGIPADIQSQIFIPFFTTKDSGTGIGMSIVRKIIVLSGGSITFRSEPGHSSDPGQGTTFRILLPGS